MKLPSKVTTYNQSYFKLAIYILKALENKQMPILDIYEIVKEHFEGIIEFIDVLDFLYLVNSIDYNGDGVIYAI